MLIDFIRLILGFVEFEAADGFSERFLNLCKINGINLWNMKNNGDKVVAFTDVKSYKRIRQSAKKSGMKVKIIKKHGLPFFINKNKVRAGVAIGLILAVLFLCFTSCLIWNIEVSGNTTVKTETLIESLKDYGVKIGSVKSRIDMSEIKKNLLKDYPDISWVSLNIFGTKAVLEVRENIKKPDVIKFDKPMNIIAEKDGQIVLVEGYRGKNIVKEGDVVVKGDLLISGVLSNADNTEQLSHSYGKVYANTNFTVVSDELWLNCVNILISGNQKYYIYFLGFDIPIFKACKGEELYKGGLLFKSKNSSLPFGINWHSVYEYEEEAVSFNEVENMLFSLLNCVEKKRSEFNNDELVKTAKYYKKSSENNIFVMCDLSGKENIALFSEILLEAD